MFLWIKCIIIGILCILYVIPYGNSIYVNFIDIKNTDTNNVAIFKYLDPYKQNLDDSLQSPSRKYILGTDFFGRDIFSRLLFAVSNTLFISVFAVCIAMSIGLILAVISISIGRMWVYISEICIDIMLAIPVFLICLILVSLYGNGKIFIIIGQCMAFIPLIFRVSIQDIRFYMQKEYITIAKNFGMTTIHVVIKHIFPFLIPKLVQQITSLIAIAISIEAGLSYLGFGIEKPEPSIGNMLYDAKNTIYLAPWYMISVIFTICFLLLCVQILSSSRQSKI